MISKKKLFDSIWAVTVSVCLILPTAVPALAQVNTETLRADTGQEGFGFTTNFNIGLSEGNVRFLNLLGNFRVDYQKNSNHSFAVVQYARGAQEGNLYRNAGFVALRNTWYFRPAVGWELFVQRQFNEFIMLRDRQLGGSGLRLRLVNFRNDDRENRFRLFLGAGGMLEYEDINAVIPEENLLVRSTNYVSMLWTLSERVGFNLVTYFQFAVTDPSDFRNLLESALEVKLAESLAITFVVNHRYDSNPPAEVRAYDIEIRNGLRVLF